MSLFPLCCLTCSSCLANKKFIFSCINFLKANCPTTYHSQQESLDGHSGGCLLSQRLHMWLAGEAQLPSESGMCQVRALASSFHSFMVVWDVLITRVRMIPVSWTTGCCGILGCCFSSHCEHKMNGKGCCWWDFRQSQSWAVGFASVMGSSSESVRADILGAQQGTKFWASTLCNVLKMYQSSRGNA